MARCGWTWKSDKGCKNHKCKLADATNRPSHEGPCECQCGEKTEE